MISRKYLSDYRIDAQVGPGGGIKSQAVYIGARYALSPAVTASDKRILLYSSALSVLAYVGALIPKLLAARTIYVLAPFAFSALPLSLTLLTVIDFSRIKGPMTRIEADRCSNRLPACPIMTVALSGGAMTALVINAIATKPEIITGDVIFTVASLTLSALSILISAKTRKIKPIKYEDS